MRALRVTLVLLMAYEYQAIRHGGRGVLPGDEPYVCYIIARPLVWNCTGIIVTNHWILTVAHCFDLVDYENNPRAIEVRAGLPPTQLIRDINRIYIHPGDEDVALVQTNTALRFTRNVQPADFGIGEFPRRGEVCTGFGWGFMGERTGSLVFLTGVDMVTVNHIRCKRDFAALEFIRKSQLCSESEPGRGVCVGGDMGGPLVCQKLVTGVMTRWLYKHWIQMPIREVCGDGRQLIMSVSIDSIYEWMFQYTPRMSVHQLCVASRNYYFNFLCLLLCAINYTVGHKLLF